MEGIVDRSSTLLTSTNDVSVGFLTDRLKSIYLNFIFVQALKLCDFQIEIKELLLANRLFSRCAVPWTGPRGPLTWILSD